MQIQGYAVRENMADQMVVQRYIAVWMRPQDMTPEQRAYHTAYFARLKERRRRMLSDHPTKAEWLPFWLGQKQLNEDGLEEYY